MKTYRIYQVDSFTKEKFTGNPAGVVTNADGLSEEQMQLIARELNNSETAFIISSDSEDYNVEVRFFTPTTEVPICGHATIAAHYARAVEMKLSSSRVIQKTKAGILPVYVEQGKDGNYRITMTQGEPKIENPLNSEITRELLTALGLKDIDLRTDCPLAIASTGHSKVMVGINSIDVLNSLNPDMPKLAALSKLIGCKGYYVFTLSPESEVLARGRMFAPAIGINEDPVTGNANGPLGAYLVHYGILKELHGEDKFTFSIIQGESIKRAGGMKVEVDIKDNLPVQVRITGDAVIVYKTEIEL